MSSFIRLGLIAERARLRASREFDEKNRPKLAERGLPLKGLGAAIKRALGKWAPGPK